MIKNKEYKVYKITCLVNNKIYFGYTCQTLRIRFLGHKQEERDTIISRTIRKYGDDNFTMELLYTSDDETDAKKKEIELIKENKTNYIKYPEGNGMNMTDGGEGAEGYKHTLELRERWSKERKGKIPASLLYRRRIREETGVDPFSKKVYCFTKDGELVKEFNSTKEAGKFFGISGGNISKCCMNIAKTVKGYVFQYESEFKKRNLEIKKSRMFGSKNPMSKIVYKFNLNGELVETYGSASEIARELGCSKGKILKHCNNERILNGFVYSYQSKINHPIIEEERIYKGKQIGKYNKDGTQLINKYYSVSKAANDNNIDRRSFYDYLKGTKEFNGYVFKYIPVK